MVVSEITAWAAELPTLRLFTLYLPVQQTLPANEVDHLSDTLAAAQVGKNEGPVPPHSFRVARHDIQVRSNVRREIGLVDDQ
jgi:hypothetical protein